jgi:palmitoyltransferase
VSAFIFYFFAILPLSPSMAATAGCLHSFLLLAVVSLGVYLTLSDPTDPIVYKEREARITRQKFDFTSYNKLCKKCETHVQSSSKHCNSCDRCVNDFDHHCKWLNNCIGKANYRPFAVLLVSFILLTAVQFLSALFSILQVMSGQSDERSAAEDYYSDVRVHYGACGSLLGLSAVPCVLTCQLGLFHIWLWTKKMTTYEYILKKRMAKDPNFINPNFENAFEPYIHKETEQPQNHRRMPVVIPYDDKASSSIVGSLEVSANENSPLNQEMR